LDFSTSATLKRIWIQIHEDPKSFASVELDPDPKIISDADADIFLDLDPARLSK
jgi:hypothetical protein